MSNTETNLERCRKCGKIITTLGSYCPNCGEKLFDDLNLEKETYQIEKTNNSLTTCPDCGQKISKRAEVCPHCGRPIAEQPKKVEQPKQNQTQNNNGSGAFGVFIGVLLAIIFAVWIIPQLFHFELTFQLLPGK